MDCDTYNILYRRFLKRGSGQMLDLAGFKPGNSFLDLCTGSGRASVEAFSRNAIRIVAIDQTRSKLSDKFESIVANSEDSIRDFNNVTFYERDVKQFLDEIKDCLDMKFDCIFCQQAINYWLKEDCVKDTVAGLVANALTAKGKFIFNTFNKKPSESPAVKEYIIDGLHYTEVVQLVDDVVSHGQFCEGYEPDYQQFRWISSEEFMELLRPYFKTITVHNNGPTDIYVCGDTK